MSTSSGAIPVRRWSERFTAPQFPQALGDFVHVLFSAVFRDLLAYDKDHAVMNQSLAAVASFFRTSNRICQRNSVC
jgi:hypothetical protein